MAKDYYREIKLLFQKEEISQSILYHREFRVERWINKNYPGIVEDRIKEFREWMLEEEGYTESEFTELFSSRDMETTIWLILSDPDKFFEDTIAILKRVINPSDERLFYVSEPVFLIEIIRDSAMQIKLKMNEKEALSKLINEIEHNTTTVDEIRVSKAIDMAIKGLRKENKKKAKVFMRKYQNAKKENPGFNPSNYVEAMGFDTPSDITQKAWMERYDDAIELFNTV